MSIDLTIVAIVFTLILLLVFFSAVVLYLAFRIKETFRKETKRGSNIVMTAFLIGVIFLAGGIMYYAATTLSNVRSQQNTGPTPTPFPSTTTTPFNTPTSTGSSPVPTSSPTGTNEPTPTATAGSSPTATPTATPPLTTVNFSVFPSTITSGLNSQVTLTFTIINPTSTTLTNAVIQTNTLFQYFTLVSSSKPVSVTTISVGNVPAGTTQVTLQLAGKTQASATVALDLIYEGMQSQLTQQITIVRGK